MVALKDGCHHPSNRDTSVGGTYSGCRQNQAWLVIAAFLLAFLREAHMLQDPNNTETDHLFIDTTHVPIYVTLNDLSSCLPLWFIEFPASCRTGRTSAGERLKQVWCHLLTTSVRAPSLLPWGEFWLLSAFAQFCTGASKCAPLSRRALTAAVRFFSHSKEHPQMRTPGTARPHVVGFILSLKLFPGTNWCPSWMSNTFQTPFFDLFEISCAVSPLESLTLGFAPKLIKNLIARLGRAPV